MSLSRIIARASRGALLQCKTCSFSSSAASSSIPLLPNRFHSISSPINEASVLPHLLNISSTFQRFGISTSASAESSEKKEQQADAEDKEDRAATKNGDESRSDQKQETGSNSDGQSKSESGKRRRRGTKRTAFSDSDSEGGLDELSKDDLVKLLLEKETLLEAKQKEIAAIQDKVLRSLAETENVMDRTRREAENSKKFAIQNFAKRLLDVADNLGRASSVVKESFAKIDQSKDSAGAVPLLKTLLEGVEMTEKQLIEVFRKFGIEKYDPTNEQFDPNKHNAVFQIPDNSKPAGTVAVVLKPGYSLHDRIIRPAEVGVTQPADDGGAS